ncbi:MAG: hypothetical protein KAT37_00700 [Candidatus Aenigmarchaeota archaeon]|nr:hypothetical protein [Candidatus Aenigmarchaeota archaeon]
MYVFGVSIPILELLVIFCIVVVVYLVILEIEFRQLKAITKKFDDEEILLSKEMRELRSEVSELKEVIKALKR